MSRCYHDHTADIAIAFWLFLDTEPNLESGANIDCCKLYRDNKAVSTTSPSVLGIFRFALGTSDLQLTREFHAQEYERIVRESIKEQLGL